jgi:CheY-like chemotaxis protein
MAGALATVLICDDEPTLRELIRVSLDGAYDFVEVDDGISCLESIRQRRPDLVVLDLMIPRRHGLDVLDDIRSDDDMRETPVLVLTAQPASADDAMRRGATRVLGKPFEPDALDAAVKDILTRT